jgi:repressor LexA
MTGLSLKQRAIADFIARFIDDKGYPPSIRDIVGGCGISSTSVVDYNLKILEKHGYIRRHHEVSRGIELLKGRRRASRQVMVPLLGQIAAGKSIPVPDDGGWDAASSAERLAVDGSLTEGREGVYALKVKGSSMVDDLIADGDIVLLQAADAVDNGQTAAVWLEDEKEVTLKKFYAEPGRVRLQPANSSFKPIYTAPENARVQGRVVAVIRKLS